jgi:hypothetical protein
MATALYPKFKQAMLDGLSPGLDTADIRAILIDAADYTYDTAHDFLDDVAGAARVAVSSTLGSVTITDGVLKTAAFAFTAVTGDVSEAVILYIHDGGADSARRLIGYFDNLSGLPITPNGQDINVTVHASGWFAI